MFFIDYMFSAVLRYTPLGGCDLDSLLRACYLPIPAFPPYVVRTLHIHGVPPSALHLELSRFLWHKCIPVHSVYPSYTAAVRI